MAEFDILFLHHLRERFSHTIALRATQMLLPCPDRFYRRQGIYREICRQNAFLPTLASHPARSNCRSFRCLRPGLLSRGYSSPERTYPIVFHRCPRRTRLGSLISCKAA